jgi:TolB-like protein/tetratricopeptide (TPR) repeat protein
VSQASQAAIPQAAIREQLERIVAHDLFARSERMGRFLRFAVEHTLDGKSDELKEYLLGIEVFDRKTSFDPRIDPIVRVEARRLRSKLKAYYDGDGRADAVVIEFVTGTYAPRFHFNSESAPARAADPGVVTIAVLPFTNLSPAPENEYFSDGLTEELIHALTKVPTLRVVAWNTAALMRDRQNDIPAIGRQLNVATVLTGSVRTAGSGLRVRAQLIESATGVYLWSETFDSQMQDIFAIQEEIARAIVRTLRVQLSGGREPAVASRGRTTVDSYHWYLKGRHLCHSRAPEQLLRSVEYFERAIAADPASALAYAGLADAYTLLTDYGVMRPSEAVALAKSAAESAIALDPELAEPHASLALVLGVVEWRWDDAERLYRRAIELNPGYAPAHHWLSVDHFAMQGRFEEALPEIQIAIDLDPLSNIILEGRGYIHVLMRRYEEALSYYQELLAFDPSFYKAYSSMGRAYSLMGRCEEAISCLDKARSLSGGVPSILAALAQNHALAGNSCRARELLAELEQLATQRYVTCTCFAVAHLGLGEKSRALEWLEKGCDRRESAMSALKVHPLYDPLRNEPRFQRLLERIGFA